jgi:hypothetical protein
MNVKTSLKGHLSEDQIIQAFIDQVQVPAEQKAHLEHCGQCRSRVDQLAQDLTRLSRMAERHAPLPKRAIHLPVEQTRHSLRGWKVGLAAAAAAALCLVIWWSVPEDKQPAVADQTMSPSEINGELMSTEQPLWENALPDVYMDIVGDSDLDMTDDFIDYVVPDSDLENDLLGSQVKYKGGKLS